MTTDSLTPPIALDPLTEEVRDKYARAALRGHRAHARPGRRLVLRPERRGRVRRAAVRARRAGLAARGRGPGQPRLRQPDGRRRAAPRRGRPRPRVRRRHRRPAVGPAGRPDRLRLRPRHDRRDARPGPSQRGRGRRRRTSSSTRAASRPSRCPTRAVDVVISNCVVNLSADKAAVFAEVARVLRAGWPDRHQRRRRRRCPDPGERAERGSFVGCIAGALSFDEYRAGPGRGRARRHPDRPRPTPSATACTGPSSRRSSRSTGRPTGSGPWTCPDPRSTRSRCWPRATGCCGGRLRLLLTRV